MILIFLIIPLFWFWLMEVKWNLKEKVLIGVSFFWLVITPIIWSLNKFGNYLITPQMFWFLISFVSLILFIFKIVKSKGKLILYLPKIKLDWALLVILIIFSILHILFYRFYVTMPESDGYTNILRIEKMVETGKIDYQYRPLFYVSMTILGQVTRLDVYQIHTFWMIIISSMYLLALSLLIDKAKIKDFWLKLLILFTGLAVPVINMEIDFFRPQSLYLLIFPIIFYLEQKNKNYLALLFSLIGLGYHQFFIFPIIVLGLKIFFNLKKINKFFLLVIGLLSAFVFREIFVSYLHINRIFEEIWKIDKWRWWFLDSYMTFPDNREMGWPGFIGAAKYYGYYFGPLIMITLGFIVFNLRKLRYQRYWLLMIGILLIISEVLPRLNVIYLPERLPLLIDLTVLLLIPFLFKSINFKKWGWIILIIIGILGSIYIAKSKGSLTNKEEKIAAEWIKNNTPTNAVILTQESNKPMVMFFSKRNFINPGKIFFEGDIFSKYFVGFDKYNRVNYSINKCQNCYILYSFNKFKGLRSERSYWNEYNYIGVNLEKFNLIFEKIYDDNGIIIWKM